MTPHDRQDCEHDIRRISELLSCGIFNVERAAHVLRESALTELMICMRDLLHKTEKYASRVQFADEILVNSYVRDVTDAVTAIRDACCHVNSFKSHFDANLNRGQFMTIYGKGTLASIGGLEIKSDYDDDLAVFYGSNRLYMKRGIVRAFEEAQAKMRPFIEGKGA